MMFSVTLVILPLVILQFYPAIIISQTSIIYSAVVSGYIEISCLWQLNARISMIGNNAARLVEIRFDEYLPTM
jgi:hypothetical protein